MTDKPVVIRQMTRAEADQLVEWAAGEGWNPGLHDAEIFWATDPEAFIAAEAEDQLVGGGAITAYGQEYGFMGFFIVRPEFRGRGYGDILWHARKERLLGRIGPGKAIGMDGVFAMQSYYAKGGFAFAYRNLRFRLDGPLAVKTDTSRIELVPATEVTFAQLATYDRKCFPADRPTFLTAWISQEHARAIAAYRDGKLAGYGVIRRCREGCKIGPLFADDSAVAEALLTELYPFAGGGSIFLDVPEINAAGMALVERLGMSEVFGCARMYLGPRPSIDEAKIFGVTTLELG